MSSSELILFYEDYGFNDSTKYKLDMATIKCAHKIANLANEYWADDLEPDCEIHNYDWSLMYEEDLYCDDRDYIENLKHDLRKSCDCKTHCDHK